ncbi:hypothetical protein [Lentzea jiangxiensis]|uniref:hypothetical protein n=1 Tax=Lentzea jiangxiensis TaxID=641025 RepID=UPI00115FE3CD|nr:hypothetical protein [Lentzea jiangxiensis]
MTLSALTREGVLAAIAEFDELGRHAFLKKYKFSKAKSYFLEYEGQLYDSKAIVGSALGLAPADFSGGDATVSRRLMEDDLGFKVRYFPVLDWTRDEILLVCAVVEANGWKQPEGHERDWRIVELSELLQTSAFHQFEDQGPDFRNPAAVGRKAGDIATSHPDYQGATTRGGKLTAQVVREFLARPAELRAEAAQIRARLLGYEPGSVQQQPPPHTPDGNAPKVFDVPVEAHRTTSFRTTVRAAERVAIRREAEMMKRYQQWRRQAGGRVTGKVIYASERTRLRIDLFDLERSELIEAKGSAERDYIRFALGQVLDYARYIDHERRAVLLPKHPGQDMVDLLSSCQVGCIYETSEGNFERA